jgi:hypothetical protein
MILISHQFLSTYRVSEMASNLPGSPFFPKDLGLCLFKSRTEVDGNIGVVE